LNQAVLCQYIKANPCLACQLPRIEKKEMAVLTGDDLKRFLIEIKGKPFEHVYFCTVFTGLRESEIIGLTWDCIDFKAGTIKINKQLIKRPKAAGGFTLAETKNDRIRVIKPAPSVMQILKARQRQQIEHRLAAGEAWQSWTDGNGQEKPLVFTTPTGANLCQQTVYNHCKKVLARIGAGDRCVHDLRHTYAVISLQNGDDVKTVQGNLGHATAAFTLDVYGHVSEKMKDASADRMEKYMQNLA
jgi:integrase